MLPKTPNDKKLCRDAIVIGFVSSPEMSLGDPSGPQVRTGERFSDSFATSSAASRNKVKAITAPSRAAHPPPWSAAGAEVALFPLEQTPSEENDDETPDAAQNSDSIRNKLGPQMQANTPK
jgi:hypothetical protein